MTKSNLYLPADLKLRVGMARNQVITDLEPIRVALDCLDLTSLGGNETVIEIKELCLKAIKYDLAAICVLPDKVKTVAKHLKSTDIKCATVINFPYGDRRTGQDECATVETTAYDILNAISDGANEIDIVQPRNEFRPGFAYDMMRVARLACPKQISLKVILETATYTDTAALADSALIAIAAGADFLKTSTGVHSLGGATLEVAAVLMQIIKNRNFKVGLKISGGVNTAEDCVQYLALRKLFFSKSNINPEKFRFGGSRLLDNLIQNLSPDSESKQNRFIAANGHDYTL